MYNDDDNDDDDDDIDIAQLPYRRCFGRSILFRQY